jgi:SAM-dependent methyltransferase
MQPQFLLWNIFSTPIRVVGRSIARIAILTGQAAYRSIVPNTEYRRTVIEGRSILVLALLWQSLVSIHAQSPAPASPRSTETQAARTHPAETRKTSQPYIGDLSIFDSPGRDERLQINRVMEILGVAPGKVVADIGAGSGWFTVRAAKRVTATGLVYAVDINPEAIRFINQRVQKEDLHNVKMILSKADDPLLPANKIDSVLLLKTYHEVEKPVSLLRNLRPALRTGAKIGVIDRNGNGENHGVAREVVIREAAQAGYTLREQYDFVKGDDMDYFLVFTAK